MPTKLQVVFQGGGARLCSLMAAAEATQELQKEGLITVTRVAGTSAGAIAACMLASGIDIAAYRARIKQLGTRSLPHIAPARHPWGNYYRAVRGYPIYNESSFRSFLSELFSVNGKFVEYLDELPISQRQLSVLLFATDILNGDLVTYSSQRPPDSTLPRHRLIDTLADTCAIPFVFRSFNRTASTIVDGGILANFPADLLIGSCPTLGEIVGFSFERTQAPQAATSALGYAKSLLFAAMDHSIRKSVQGLGPGRVLFIKTDIETLDFAKSLSHGLGEDHSGRVQLQAEKFIRGVVHRIEESVRTDSGTVSISPSEPAATLPDIMGRLYEFHESTFDPTAVRIKRITIYVYANSLLGDGDMVNGGDDVETEIEIEPIGKGIKSYRIGMASRGESPVNGIMNYRMVDKNGVKIKASAFPVTKADPGDPLRKMHHLILIFHERLVPDGDGPYKLSTSWTTYGAVDGLVNAKVQQDRISWTSSQASLIDRFEIVCFIPKRVGRIVLEDLPLDQRPKGQWVSGQQMDDTMLGNLRAPRPAFDPYGWYAKELRQGETTGVLLRRSNVGAEAES